jgi:hypothetical protein
MVKKKTEILQIPDAPHRPGDSPRFEKWNWSPEDLKLLEIDCSVDESKP